MKVDLKTASAALKAMESSQRATTVDLESVRKQLQDPKNIAQGPGAKTIEVPDWAARVASDEAIRRAFRPETAFEAPPAARNEAQVQLGYAKISAGVGSIGPTESAIATARAAAKEAGEPFDEGAAKALLQTANRNAIATQLGYAKTSAGVGSIGPTESAIATARAAAKKVGEKFDEGAAKALLQTANRNAIATQLGYAKTSAGVGSIGPTESAIATARAAAKEVGEKFDEGAAKALLQTANRNAIATQLGYAKTSAGVGSIGPTESAIATARAAAKKVGEKFDEGAAKALLQTANRNAITTQLGYAKTSAAVGSVGPTESAIAKARAAAKVVEEPFDEGVATALLQTAKRNALRSE